MRSCSFSVGIGDLLRGWHVVRGGGRSGLGARDRRRLTGLWNSLQPQAPLARPWSGEPDRFEAVLPPTAPDEPDRLDRPERHPRAGFRYAHVRAFSSTTTMRTTWARPNQRPAARARSSSTMATTPTAPNATGTTPTLSASRAATRARASGVQTGLYYYGARYYDPEVARFIQADSTVPEGGSPTRNRYTYCLNNPLRFIDPSGNTAQDWSTQDVAAMLADPYSRPSQNLSNSHICAGVSDLMLFPEGRMVVSMFINQGATALSQYMVGGPAIAQAFEHGFFEGSEFYFGSNYVTVGEVRAAIKRKESLEFAKYKFMKLTADAAEMAISEIATIGIGAGLGALAGALRRAGAGARTWSPMSDAAKFWKNAGSGIDDVARASDDLVRWNNGWRTPDGKFASPFGPGRPGAAAEREVWEAVAAKPGWDIIPRHVSVRDAAGQLRRYDGVAVSPRGRYIGLEVKSGSAPYYGSQRAFDSALNASGRQTVSGVGQNSGLKIRRAKEIRR